ncbi:MAG: hypothetical protein ABSA09_04850, partial [Desulfobaccales bacterium]
PIAKNRTDSSQNPGLIHDADYENALRDSHNRLFQITRSYTHQSKGKLTHCLLKASIVKVTMPK